MLSSCDKAVNSLKLDIDAQKKVSSSLDLQVQLLVKQNEQLKAQEGAWYHDPKILIPFGLVIGILGGVFIAK